MTGSLHLSRGILVPALGRDLTAVVLAGLAVFLSAVLALVVVAAAGGSYWWVLTAPAIVAAFLYGWHKVATEIQIKRARRDLWGRR